MKPNGGVMYPGEDFFFSHAEAFASKIFEARCSVK
jgi:hypothetical protein